jgi:MFS family permease
VALLAASTTAADRGRWRLHRGRTDNAGHAGRDDHPGGGAVSDREGNASRPGELRALLTASGISGIGDGVRQAALPLLVASLTRSAVAVAAVAVAQTLSWLVFSMPAGAMIDQRDRRRVILAVNVIRGLLMVALGGLVLAGAIQLPLLMALAFVFGAVEVYADAAAQALLPALVPRGELARVNGRLFALQIGTPQIVGPPLGGLLFAVGRSVPFVIDGISFLGAAVLLRRIRVLPPAETSDRRLREQIVEGISFLLRNRVLRGVAILSAAGNLLLQGFVAVFVLYVLEVLHGRSLHYGVFLAVMAVGVTVGSLLADRARRWLGETAVLFCGAALMSVPLLATALVASVYVTGAVMLVAGLGTGLWQVIASSLRQAITPDRLLGRVMSSYRLIGRGASFLGAAMGGLLASAFGLRAPALVCALGMVVVLALSLRSLTPAAIAEARAVAFVTATRD